MQAERTDPAAGASGQSFAASATVVCVIGAPRSGTSLTTRILDRAGVYLGPREELPAPRPWNQHGSRENKPITGLNDDLLAALRGSITKPPRDLPRDWELREEIAPYRARAIGLLDERFGGRALWGWKDPRTTLTLPFWQQLIPEMRYVICIRNPVDVVASSKQISAIRESRSELMNAHLTYLAAALAHTSGAQRLFVAVDELLSLPESLGRLWRFVHDDRAPQAVDLARMREAIDPGLIHHRASDAEAARDLPVELVGMYLTVRLLAQLQSAAPAGVAELEAAVDQQARRLIYE